MKILKLGILGGGQLGRMSAMAAARLGIQTLIYTPEENSPAAQVSAKTFVAQYDDKEALKNFAKDVDIISYEFENIPIDTIEFLKQYTPVLPNQSLLDVSQDRIQEKTFLNKAGLETARWIKYETPKSLTQACEMWDTQEIILKTTRFGYDGKGQYRWNKDTSSLDMFSNNAQELIIEEIVDFDYEISVIVARDFDKKIVTYGPMLNHHKNHILHTTTAPAPIDKNVTIRAVNMANKFSEAIDLQGLLTVEFFVTKDKRVLANEIAPRTHNSGHWTIDACAVSQFENHVRSVCGLPVIDPAQHSKAVMTNLIGDDANTPSLLGQPGLHLYGKDEARAGRKMGHITEISPLSDQ